MSKPTYWELLRRPEWQKKRLQIMERADFKCEICGAADRTLNVHHKYYAKGKAPWEYPDETLQCLCEPCHKQATERSEEFKAIVGRLGDAGLEQLIGYAKGLLLIEDSENFGNADGESASAWVFSWEQAQGLADSYTGLHPRRVDDLLKHIDNEVTHDGVMAALGELFPSRVKAHEQKQTSGSN